ncbi:MAG: hypothetical protein GF328_05990, partial [Candidatus Latescibacteria bacterium]|nr:hypothetical protein [Candidatus Latescibacterota bacterium]
MILRLLLRPIGRWLKRRAEDDPNRITIWIVPAKAQRTDQIELPGWCGPWAGRLFGLAMILLLVAVAADLILLRRVVRTEGIRDENHLLRTRLERMEDLERQLAELDRFRRQLAFLAGIPESELPGGPGGGADTADWAATAIRPPRIDLTEAARDTPFRV